MISNTDAFYHAAYEFQTKRGLLVSEYEGQMSALEKYKGSVFYTERSRELREGYERDLTALQNGFRERIFSTIRKMKETAQNKPMKAPSDDQIKIIQMLRMKENLSEAELDSAFNAVKDCPVALGILQDIAKKHGSFTNYSAQGDALPISYVNEKIDSLLFEVQDFLKYDTDYANRRIKQWAEIHGRSSDKPVLKRSTFSNKAECFSQLGNIQPDELNKFCSSVDEEGEEK